jgi:hypothetical protein
MKRFFLLNLLAIACVLGGAHFAATTRAQTVVDSTNVRRVPMSADEVNRVVREFTAKETVFRSALNSYAFKREAVVQTIGMGGQISGEYRRDSQFIFTADNRRTERITFFPRRHSPRSP